MKNITRNCNEKWVYFEVCSVISLTNIYIWEYSKIIMAIRTENEVDAMNMKEKGMQKKVFLLVAAVAAVAVATLVLVLALGGKEETYRSIKIIELEGGVTIERDGVGTLEASSNMNLISGDAVKTGQDAYAVLQLDSDKYVMLAEAGSMTVVAEGNEAGGRTAIRLDAGSVLSEIQNPLSNGSSYDIVTPNATMSVRGTVFEVRKNGDDTTGDIEVLVYDGKVDVTLEEAEPVRYEAGEYTQFTAGENPRFTVERTEITDEHLNPQFLERLEQINSQSRELNLGSAQLSSGQSGEDVSEPRQTPEVSEPAATPVRTADPATLVPSAAPAATPKPVRVPVSQAPVQTPVTVTPTQVPAVVTPEPDHDDDDDEEEPPTQPSQPEPIQPTQKPEGNNNGKYQDVWKTYTMADYRQQVSDYQQSVSGGNAAVKECTVIFYVPYIVKVNNNLSTMRNDAPVVYSSVKVQAGSLVAAPQPPIGMVNYSETQLQFVDWCLEDGTIWDFSVDTVEADTCLYPVWKDNASSYFPVICRCAEAWGYYHYCNSVAEGSSLDGITLPDSVGHTFAGWERVNHQNAPWIGTDVIQGAESLKASWSN